MGIPVFLSLALAGLLLIGPARAGMIIEVDEDGNGVGTVGAGSLMHDPGPGGLPAVLTYRLPFSGVVGDVNLTEPFAPASDIIRFNGNDTLVYYSSSADGFDSLADTITPPGIPYLNIALRPEGDTTTTYTPGPGQPGYDPGAQPTYVFVSGAVVPEPASLVLGGTAALVGLGCWWRRRFGPGGASRPRPRGPLRSRPREAD
jgi:hypothetical protein